MLRDTRMPVTTRRWLTVAAGRFPPSRLGREPPGSYDLKLQTSRIPTAKPYISANQTTRLRSFMPT